MLRREFLKKTGMVMAGLAVAPQLILEIQPPIYNDFNGVLTCKGLLAYIQDHPDWVPHSPDPEYEMITKEWFKK